MRVLVHEPRRWAIALAAWLAIVTAARPAAAQRYVVEVNGTVNAGYTQITQSAFQADPNAEPEDVRPSSTGGAFTELRPGVSISSGSPRLTWLAGYQFSSNFVLGDGRAVAYGNQANVALAAQPTKYTQTSFSAAIAQGGTSFLLSQRPAETADPEIRAPGNPSTLSLTLAESLGWEAGKQLGLRQGLATSASAPQDQLDKYSATLTGTLGLDRLFRRDTAGLEVRSTLSWLQPLAADAQPYASLTNAALVRWNHDFTWKWNGLVTAGVEQVYADTNNEPLGLFPAGSAALRYSVGPTVGALEYSHGSATNLQVGTVTLTDRLTARGVYTLNVEQLRALSFSAGFLNNAPLGESANLDAAGVGKAIQGDVGFTSAITKSILVTARYSIAYQFDQGTGVEPSLAHIALVGVTARYTNLENERRRPRPVRAQRVDGSDGPAFPTGDAPQRP